MSDAPARALVVDDERMNREVIVANLRAAGFETVMAEDGVQAWGILQAHPGSFDVILLDRRMPRMNGMELLTRLKADDKLAHIPVIMQTAYAETEDVSEGIKAGAYYYLAKPLDRRLLLSVTEAAIADHQRRQRLADDLDKRTTAILLLEQGRFRFRTLEEGHTLAVALARSCPQARHLAAGLSEMFTNAVEHGNLGIDFDLKAELVAAKRWRQEIEARLDTPWAAAAASRCWSTVTPMPSASSSAIRARASTGAPMTTSRPSAPSPPMAAASPWPADWPLPRWNTTTWATR